ncbi:MAG: hypothetical protein AAF800_03245 [Planctomycetota bacterium]
MNERPASRLRQRRWSIAGLVLLTVWVGVAGVAVWARAATPTPMDAVAAAEAVRGANDSERESRVEALTRSLRRLTLRQRSEPEVAEALRGAVLAMNTAQQRAFLDATLPMGLDEMVEGYLALNNRGRGRVSEWVHSQLGERGWLPEGANLGTVRRLLDGSAEAFAAGDDPQERLEALLAMTRVLHVMRDLDPGDAAAWWAGEDDD